MIKEGKIGVQEAVCLVVIAISNRVFFTAPAVVDRSVGTAGWYMALVSNVTTIIFFNFIYMLLKRFPEKNILEIFEITYGRVLGFAFSFIYAASFTAACGILAREFVEVLKVFVFPETPLTVLIGSLAAVIMVSAFLGLESIARVGKLLGYTLLSGFILLLVLGAHQYESANLFPILGYGLGKTILEGISRSSAFSEVIVLAVIAGALQGPEYIRKIGYTSLLLSGLIVSAGIMVLQLAFPYYTFQELAAPLYIMARVVSYGVFFQRMDPLFLFLYIMLTVVASSLVFYCAVSSYCKTFRLQDTRPTIMPMAILLFAIAMIPKDFESVVEKYIEVLRIFPILIFYILLFITLIAAILRKKKGLNYGSQLTPEEHGPKGGKA